MKKKLLLIMPNFFDYPREISEELNEMGYEVDYFDDRPSTSGLIKAIIRINKNIIRRYIDKYFHSVMNSVKVKKYDIVFLISGQSLSFSEEMIKQIKEIQLQAKFILYQWDSLDNFPYIERVHHFFDKCYSFDRNDVKKHEYLTFLPLFYTQRYEKIGYEKKADFKYDFCFIGTAHPKKYRFIKMMTKQLTPKFPKQFIYYFFPSRIVFLYRKFVNPEFKDAHYKEFHFKALSGNELENIYRESRCVLDCAQDRQYGLTIRVLEALGAEKKLITTNPDVVNYDFFREENIYVYDGQFNYSSKFFTSSYCKIEDAIYKKYSLRNWLNIILEMETKV